MRLKQNKLSLAILLATACLAALAVEPSEASQGCPFEDGSCQEYCQQQGCNMGYCGHFAWIQCICRKCGDEWSYYDKVHYNSDKTVNQTELESLKLNRTSPLILVGSNSGAPSGLEQQQKNSTNSLKTLLTSQLNQRQQQASENKSRQATLTTLLIPDLSDPSKIDLNDIPDENSDKFLDYLAKNHEKLVQASNAESQSNGAKNEDESQEEEAEAETESSQATTSTVAPLQAEPEETVEIRIRSSNNNLRIEREQREQVLVPELKAD